jgi:hypothetical protein
MARQEAPQGRLSGCVLSRHVYRAVFGCPALSSLSGGVAAVQLWRKPWLVEQASRPRQRVMVAYRRPINLGQRCRTWQRVRGGLLRCRAFEYPRRKYQMGFRPGHVPFNRGRSCVKFQNVWSPWYNGNVRRCKSYGPGSGFVSPPPAGWGARYLPVRPILPSPRTGATIPGYIPLSMPSMEKAVAGRTPV